MNEITAITLLTAILFAGCASNNGRVGVRRDGSYYTRIEWAQFPAYNELPDYWVNNLIDDDIRRNGGSWGAHSCGKPANVVLSFFGEPQAVGSIRFFHNVGADVSRLEELAKQINVYVSNEDKAGRMVAQSRMDDIVWTKVNVCHLEKKEYWAEFNLEKPVVAKYVRLELVANFFDRTKPLAPETRSKAEWVETNEVKIFP